MTPTYQQTHDLATFQANVQQVPGLTTQTDATFSSRQVSGSTGTASGTITTPEGDLAITITASNNGDSWSIAAILVNGNYLQ